MNEQDTLALWRLGKGAWEGWARSLIEKKKTLTAARSWSTDWYGEGQNDETKAWLQDATADFTKAVFEAAADFTDFTFPGPALFERARFLEAASFTGATFTDNASFDRAQFAASDFTGAKFSGFAAFAKTQFAGRASFKNAEFQRVCDLAPCACFRGAQFCGYAAFSGAQFAGVAEFLKTSFAAARFDGCEFRDDALFGAAHFAGPANFSMGRFSGTRIDFERSAFADSANFSQTHFGASWARLVASGAGCVSFENTRFEKDVSFRKSWFVGESQFKNARFTAPPAFDETLFVLPANFAQAVFPAGASFTGARFEHEANFSEAQFLGACEFTAAKFAADARFPGAHFAAPAKFVCAEFMGIADFHGVAAEAELAFEGAKCASTPDFAEGKLAEAPSLDKLIIVKQKRGVIEWLRRRRRGERRLLAPDAVQTPGAARPEQIEDAAEPDVIVPETLVISRTTSTLTASAIRALATAATAPPAPAGGAAAVEAKNAEPEQAEATAAGTEPSKDEQASPATPQEDTQPADVTVTQPPAENEASPMEPENTQSQRAQEAAAGTPSLEVEHVEATPAVPVDPPGEQASPPAEVGTDAPAEKQDVPSVPKEPAQPASASASVPEPQPETASTPSPARPETSAAARRPRSLLRPFMAWIFMILAFTPFYLGQRPATPSEPGQAVQAEGAPALSRLQDAAASLSRRVLETASARQCVHGDSHAAAEALFLSTKNALVFVPWENEQVMRRAYGCLYGVEGPAPVIPVAVSLGALAQALVSLLLLAAALLALTDRVRRK